MSFKYKTVKWGILSFINKIVYVTACMVYS